MKNIHFAKLIGSIVYFLIVTTIFFSPWNGVSSPYPMHSTLMWVFEIYIGAFLGVSMMMIIPLGIMGRKITRLAPYIARGKFSCLIIIYLIIDNINSLINSSEISALSTETLRTICLLYFAWFIWVFDDFCNFILMITDNKKFRKLTGFLNRYFKGSVQKN